MSVISFGSFAQEKRLALVIGNAEYENGVSLKNPANDATLMASTLEDLGFEVMKHVNTTKLDMEKAMYEFSKQLKEYDVTLFYYAGHGLLVDGVNYLIPTDAKLEEKMSTQFEAVDISKLVTQFNQYQDNTNIVILDACRNNPFSSWSRGVDRGFKPIPASSGSIIAYATEMGAAAADGDGANGLYTSKLVEQMNIPQRIEDVFIKTRIAVRKASENTQSPQEWSQLTGAFYFKKGANAQASLNRVQARIGDSKDVAVYGDIMLSSEIKGGLFLDGEYLGNVNSNSETPIEEIEVGLHSLEIKGLNDWKKEVYIKKDETTNVKAILTDEIKAFKDELKYKVNLGVSVVKLLNEGYNILDLLDAGVTENDLLGTLYKGGRIFYVNTEDGTGLVSALRDQKDGAGVSWDEAKDIAATYSTDEYSDWYLPSKEELNLMYMNLKKNHEGNFADNVYWSSTVGNKRSTVAWRQGFTNGYQYENYTYLKYNVRAIRSFDSLSNEN